jgi:hypothetical protein
MAQTVGAVLVAEIGTQLTRVALIDQVDGESRLVGRAETSSSVEPPYQNALYGVLEAAAQVAEMTGRQLIREGQIIMPQMGDHDGVSQVVITTSAAGALALVITAIAGDVSARSAVHASRGTYTALLQVVTLDDAVGQPAVNAGDLSWIERQVQSLLTLRPDAVLIAGGLEDGAVDAVNRLAHIVGLTALSFSVDASGQQRQELTARPVIYAGNSNAREYVVEALSDRAEISVVENVRPALDRERLEPARQELSRLYEKQILPRLPGVAALRRMSRVPLRTVCDAQGLMARFLAERFGRRVLLVDAGAASAAAFYAAAGSYHLAVLGGVGTSYGLTGLLAERGLAAVARWLPTPLSDEELTHRLLNKAMRPQLLPADRADLYLEHAVAREALSLAIETLRDEHPAADYDWLIAGGGVLAHAPHPGLALLTLLDALQPAADQAQPLVEVHLDTLNLAQACGALAALDPDTAVTVCDRDLLGNMPLATIVVPLGEGRPGDVAVEVELAVVGGRSERRTVRHGEIVRLPLAPRRYGQLTLRPVSGVRVGRGAAGEVVASDAGAVRGSALGVVIDARGRPLRLPESADERAAVLKGWLVALGVERAEAIAPTRPPVAAPAPALAVLPVSPLSAPSAPAEAAGAAVAGKRISLADLAAQERAAPPPEVASGGAAGKRISLADLAAQERAAPPAASQPASALDRDLDALRQTVEPPKKRGLFGRKK